MSDYKELIKRLRGEGRKLQPQINYDAADALENSVPISELQKLIDGKHSNTAVRKIQNLINEAKS